MTSTRAVGIEWFFHKGPINVNRIAEHVTPIKSVLCCTGILEMFEFYQSVALKLHKIRIKSMYILKTIKSVNTT